MPGSPENRPSAESPPSILIVRPDRIGDVILSTPVIAALRARFPTAWIGMLVQPALVPLLKDLPELDEVVVYDPRGEHRGRAGAQRLRNRLSSNSRSRPWDAALVLQNTSRVVWALARAGISWRVGPRGPLYTYLLYHKSLRQHRSRAEYHETQYGLQLADFFIRSGPWFKAIADAPVTEQSWRTQVQIGADQEIEAKRRLSALGWQSKGPSVAIHAGMGGSALNWPRLRYAELAESLLRSGTQVVLTGGVTEKALVEEIYTDIARRLSATPASRQSLNSLLAVVSQQMDSIAILGGVFRQMNVVVAPSTGPLHLAVALQVPVVGIYPPIRVQSAKRWGPYQAERAAVVAPGVKCPEVFQCAGEACPYYFCMDQITVEQVHAAVQAHLEKRVR